MIIEKNGQRILTLDDWYRAAPPMSTRHHWVDDRSAKEVARAWLQQPAVPEEILSLLTSNPDTSSVEVDRVEPEALLHFDDRVGPRNADLAIWAHDPRGAIAITVEAKADETFDEVVTDVFSDALERLVKTPRSGGVTRIAQLAQSLFGPAVKGHPRITTLRYQLLTATAGTLAHAAALGADRAVLLIQEFVTAKTSRDALLQNAVDLDAFVQRLSSGGVEHVPAGQLCGPFMVPGEPLFKKPASFYVGKAVRHLGTPSV